MFYLNNTSDEALFSEAQIYENMNRVVKSLDYKPVGYGKKDFPSWAHAVGWTLLVGALLMIPTAAFRTLFKNSKNHQSLQEAFLERYFYYYFSFRL